MLKKIEELNQDGYIGTETTGKRLLKKVNELVKAHNSRVVHTQTATEEQLDKDTYKVAVYCDNCNERADVLVPQGERRDKFSPKSRLECSNCGCALFEKGEWYARPRDY